MATLDQQQTSYGSLLDGIYEDNYAGQTFQAGLSGTLTSIRLWLIKASSPDNCIVEIRTVSGGEPTSTVLATSDEVLPASVAGGGGNEVTFTFPSPATIVSGTDYAIVFKQKADGGNSTDKYWMKGIANGSAYINGDRVSTSDGGSNWAIATSYDMYFQTYVETATEVLSDINNDFRFVKNYALDDINNDFRMVSTLTQIDINNDFRLSGASLFDFNNDFRFVESNIVLSDINNDFRFRLEVLKNINNKFNTVKLEVEDFNNKFTSVIEVKTDAINLFNLVDSKVYNVNNDIRTHKIEVNNISNDFRLIADWQIPGDTGFQSLGKTYIKVYIDSVEQTDTDIDSVSITKILNGTHTASFELGRAYDSTKPSMEAIVEIKYKDWAIYKGYIINISPTDSPESIRISCNDKYWKQNKTNKYFFVGHKPQDDKEKYYNTIQEALASEISYSVDIGNFIPQTMSLFGEGESDCISSLVQNAGNFSWFYKEDESKKLWTAGQGDIINLEAQSIGTNLGLYQIIRHQFSETVEGLINKFRVQMGEKTIRKFDSSGGTKYYSGYRYKHFAAFAQPAWSSNKERLARNASSGYGWDYHTSENDEDYKDVFRKYYLPTLDPELENYSDRYPPKIEIYAPGSYPYGFRSGILTEGFTIDYEAKTITFSEPIIFWDTDNLGNLKYARKAGVKLLLWKTEFYSYTSNPTEDPEITESNPLLFFTDKMGTYSDTIIKPLDLSGLSIQEGVSYTDPEGNEIVIPSWDDTNFATDFANWQLSKLADKKVVGSIDITLDTFMFYGIDLSKRIMIDNVIDNPLNINSITINISNFTATINLESNREYKRSVSIPSHGE